MNAAVGIILSRVTSDRERQRVLSSESSCECVSFLERRAENVCVCVSFLERRAENVCVCV
jgi:hypothetical protein